MGRLNRYLLKTAALNIGGLIIFALVVLLLERLLRIFEVVSTSSQPASDATSMVINLLPHYLGIAVPVALLLGVIITVDRFSRSSEMTAAMGAGISLMHMTKPFLLIAAGLATFSLLLEGYMQPVGRYNYRQVEHMIKQQSFTAALRAGNFTQVGNRTFFGGTERPGSAIGPVFIYEELDGDENLSGIRLITATEGELIVREETQEPVLRLAEGQAFLIGDNKQLDGEFSFEGSNIAGAATVERFRTRGQDERELTSIELFKNRYGNLYPSVDMATNNAALHLRLGRAALLLILPFIGVPFGLNYGRNPSSAGIFIGVVSLVALQKALEFGQSLGANGIIPPWMGIWPLITVVALFAAYIFWKSAYRMGQPPLTAISLYVAHLTEQLTNRTINFRKKFAERL